MINRAKYNKRNRNILVALNGILNKPGYHSTASFSMCVGIHNDVYNDGVDLQNYSNLDISDCSKKISLELEYFTKEELSNSLYKLKCLEKVCADIKYILIQSHLLNDQIKKVKKKAKNLIDSLDKEDKSYQEKVDKITKKRNKKVNKLINKISNNL